MDRKSAFSRIMRKVVPKKTINYRRRSTSAPAKPYARRANPPKYKVPKTPKTSGRGWK